MNPRVLVGLGNPGARFTDTRHNAGYLVVDELARRFGAAFRGRGQAQVARHAGFYLAKPTTFMNASGSAVLALLSRGGIRPAELLVIHDDLDLPLGRLRFKQGGGAGGQNGVKDIIASIGPDFLRLKVGVGRPPENWTAVNWVLSRFQPAERPLVERVVTAAADAVERLLDSGLEAAMNATNGLDLAAPSEDGEATPEAGEATPADTDL